MTLPRLSNPVFFIFCIISQAAIAQEDTVTNRLNSAFTDHVWENRIPTGYENRRQIEITGAIQYITSSDFNKGNIHDSWQLIQGRVSGMDVSRPGSDPNGTFYLRLRGLSTINASDQPLVVINGIPCGDIQNIIPSDIESFTILKDGASSSIYGLRGSNGVILINTKRGTKGVSSIEYNSFITAEKVAKNTPMMNAGQWRALYQEFADQTGVVPGPDFGYNTNWFKEIEQTALSHAHTISLSGGTDKSAYRASVDYRNVEGIQRLTGYSQFAGRIFLSQELMHDRLDLTMELAGIEKISRPGFPEAFRYAAIFNPTAPVKSNQPEYAMYDGYFQQTLFDYYNPVSIIEENRRESKERILDLSLRGSYRVTSRLSLDAVYAFHEKGMLGGEYYDKNDFWGGINRNGFASRNYDNAGNQFFESYGHYLADITPSLNLRILAGYSFQDFVNEGFSAAGGNFLTDELTFNNLSAAQDFSNGRGIIDSYKNSNKIVAFYGTAALSFRDLLFINAGVSYEGSSRLGKNRKWGFFPSLGVAFDLAKLTGKTDNLLKMRMSWGLTGNEPVESYLSLMRFNPGGWCYNSNGSYFPSFVPASNSNPDLGWEKNRQFNAGFDFSLFKSRISGSVDLYKKSSTDLLYQYYVPSPPNLAQVYQWMNVGKMKSSGMELSLSYDVISGSNISYSIVLDQSVLFNNTLVSLSGEYNGTSINFTSMDIGDVGSPGMCCVTLIKVTAGKPVGQLSALVLKEIDPDGTRVFEDSNNDGFIDGYYDRQVVGNGLPKYLLGFANSLKYRRWELDIFFRGVFGHYLVNLYRGQYESPFYLGYYNVPVTTADLRNPVTKKLMISYGAVVTDQDVENASFLSIDNISLGYDFSLREDRPFRMLKVYVAASRLLYITKYNGSDPEARYRDSDKNLGTYNNPLVPGVDRRDTWPRTRSVTFGLNVEFN
jgi:TonB-linked SusC/RagA family outer membrane protein